MEKIKPTLLFLPTIKLNRVFVLRKNVGIEYSNLIANLDRHTNIIQIRMKQKLWVACSCCGNERGLL